MHKMTDYIICFDEQWQIGGAFESVIFSILFGAACDTEIAYSNSSVFQDFVFD